MRESTRDFLRRSGLLGGKDGGGLEATTAGSATLTIGANSATMTLVLPSPTYVGNAIPVTMTFTVPVIGLPQDQWTPTDPGAVSLTWTAGTEGSPVLWTYADSQLTKVSTGVYFCVLETTDAPGRWTLVLEGTDPCASVAVAGFNVSPLPTS